MVLIEKKGDLIEAFKLHEMDCMTHCANAFCTMKSGIAWSIRLAYPAAYLADCDTAKGDRAKMGTCSVATIDQRRIFNLYGQYEFGYDGKQYVEYDALEKGFEYIRNYMIIYGLNKLGLPKNMGCARAGGKWEEVMKIIHRVFDNTNLIVMIYDYDNG